MGSAIFGLFATLLGSLFNNMLSKGAASEARQETFEFNEKAADNADKRTRALYTDLQSPKAQIEQIKEAGLSPSLYYGGMGSSGVTTGAQGGGGGQFMPQIFGVNAAEAAQVALTQAQKENIEADTNLKQTQAGKNESDIEVNLATIAEKYANVGNTEASTKLTNLQSEYQKFINWLAQQKGEFELNEAEWRVNKLIWDTEEVKYRALYGKNAWEIQDDTKEELKRTIELQNQELAMKIALAGSQKRLTDMEEKTLREKFSYIQKEYQLQLDELQVHKKDANTRQEAMMNLNQNTRDQIGIALKEYELDYDQYTTNTIFRILGAAGEFAGHGRRK